jgi:uncharacterized membrane protein
MLLSPTDARGLAPAVRGRGRAPLRRRRASRRTTPFAALFGALVAAQVAYPRVRPERQSAATAAILWLALASSAAAELHVRSPRRVLALLGSAGSVGLVAELVGTATGWPFGRYRYGTWRVGGLLSRRPRLRVALSAAALAAWDVFLDPRMVRDGYWEWPGGGRYEGVPASNYVGWLLTASGVFAVWAVVERDSASGDEADGAALRVDVGGRTFANAVIWRRPRVALAGGTSMAAFAVPALAARLRGPRR